MKEFKQVIVIRHDLHMRQGKAVAQGAHASMMFLVANGFEADHTAVCWFHQGMKKVCVRVESEDELKAVMDSCRNAGVRVFPVMDAGHTEFHGVPTLTCCAIGPDDCEKIDAITGHLRLL